MPTNENQKKPQSPTYFYFDESAPFPTQQPVAPTTKNDSHPRHNDSRDSLASSATSVEPRVETSLLAPPRTSYVSRFRFALARGSLEQQTPEPETTPQNSGARRRNP